MTQRHYWCARLVKGGPVIPVQTVYCGPLVEGEEQDRSPRWQALVRDETTGRAVLMGDHIPIEVDGVMLRNIEPIKEADYLFMVDHAKYMTKKHPDHPEAQPNTEIDWNTYLPRF